jgi:hypothetical protein
MAENQKAAGMRVKEDKTRIIQVRAKWKRVLVFLCISNTEDRESGILAYKPIRGDPCVMVKKHPDTPILGRGRGYGYVKRRKAH